MAGPAQRRDVPPAPLTGPAGWLFPSPPRSFRGQREARIALRALHVLATGVLLGGHVFAQQPGPLGPWLAGSLATGALLLALDLFATFALLCELRGALVLLKIALVALVVPLWSLRVWLLVAALVLGVLGSHMSGALRHRLLWLRGRVTVDRSKG